MKDGKRFSELEIEGKKLTELEPTMSCNDGMYRLYVVESESGFDAMAVGFHSCVNHPEWECSELHVDVMLECVAYFDGIRHMWWYREDEICGYTNSPSVAGIAEILMKLREIELKKCCGCDK